LNFRDNSIAVEPIELLSKCSSNVGPQQHTIFTALTTSTANDSVDMERLETLGDSFLKLASSLFLFNNYSLAEGKLTEVNRITPVLHKGNITI
jgi:dsRNA-specific ribonuclease